MDWVHRTLHGHFIPFPHFHVQLFCALASSIQTCLLLEPRLHLCGRSDRARHLSSFSTDSNVRFNHTQRKFYIIVSQVLLALAPCFTIPTFSLLRVDSPRRGGQRPTDLKHRHGTHMGLVCTPGFRSSTYLGQGFNINLDYLEQIKRPVDLTSCPDMYAWAAPLGREQRYTAM
ncbi:hypothetical protein B0J11DRAFT_534149 [Dendryphion nanum]|uniref:Uncharacterized protein n=1 Tax=Dendryphion nanum TaxID=256645 RepID=A0A9P9DIG6_9PLEO|nr:hypothetical protein B0J11DRAFT_534149 [Dendryphion nanum]